MRNKRVVLIWIGLMFVLLLGLYFDKEISVIFEHIRFPVLNDIFLGITFISSEITIFFILTSLFLWQEKKRKWILPLWLTLFVSTAISFILKITVQRLRPVQDGIVTTLPGMIQANFATWNYSFPSYQAMLVFCAVPLLNKEFPKLKYFWVGFASLVALSRVYLGVHYISDVIAGAFIGLIIGSLIVTLEKEDHFVENIARKWIK